MHICSFSSDASELKKSNRNAFSVLGALSENPRISTWDMSELKWLRDIVSVLESEGLIAPEVEPYPWHKWKITDSGSRLLMKGHANA